MTTLQQHNKHLYPLQICFENPLPHIFAGGRVPGAGRGDLDGGGQVVHRGAAAQRALHDDGLRPHRRRRPRRLRQPRRVPRRSQRGNIVEGDRYFPDCSVVMWHRVSLYYCSADPRVADRA